MPDECGLKLFDYFPTYNFEVIFITAFNQYAIPAIRHAALDYLLKPINFIDIQEALSRYKKEKGKQFLSTAGRNIDFQPYRWI